MPLPPIEILPLDYDSQAHREGLVRLLAGYADTPQGCGIGMTEPARAAVVRTLQTTPHAWVVMAAEEGRPIGLAVCVQSISTFAARPVFNLHDLVVASEHRRRGVGRRLIEAVEAEARSRGCCAVTLEVVGDNESAMRLYRACGFQGGYAVSPPNAVMFWKKRLA